MRNRTIRVAKTKALMLRSELEPSGKTIIVFHSQNILTDLRGLKVK